MKVVKTVILIVIVLSVFLFCGTCAWQNCRDTSLSNLIPEQAMYKVTVKATGSVYPTKVMPSITGVKVGERKYTVHGYWQLKDNKFYYFKGDLPLDEKYFGEIKLEPIKRSEVKK